MSPNVSHEDSVREHEIFWMLVNKAGRRDDVARAYLTIQAAIAYRQASVDVGWSMSAMMAAGRRTMNGAGDPIGASGLAYFHWLYEVQLSSAEDRDYHYYHFRRRHDDAQVMAYLRTAPAPKSLQFQQEYERTRRRLEKRRAILLANYRGRYDRGTF